MAFYYRTRRALPIFRWRRHLSSSSSSSKVALLWESKSTDSQKAVTVQLYSWGRGASGQLGGGIEEIRIYPSPVASFSLSPTFRLSSPIPGRLPSAPVLLSSSFNEGKVDVEIGISCGLFHSALLVDGNLWIWGKGDGGRLGFGHENPVFVPTLNTHLDSVRSVALGGLHSVALNSLGQVFTWSVPIPTLYCAFFAFPCDRNEESEKLTYYFVCSLLFLRGELKGLNAYC